MIGLGTGTIAAYSRIGDLYRFYDINPLVEQIANNYFWYLKNAEGSTEVVLGDARLSLEREAPQNYDILAVDAFSSDSIPVHLLTREAMALYFRHLKPGGVLAVHISNRFINLEPVLERASSALGKPRPGWSRPKTIRAPSATAPPGCCWAGPSTTSSGPSSNRAAPRPSPHPGSRCGRTIIRISTACSGESLLDQARVALRLQPDFRRRWPRTAARWSAARSAAPWPAAG